MILVDTSVWIDHLRKSESRLRFLLDERQVLSHSFVIGELAMGSFRQRDVLLQRLCDLPRAIVAFDDEVLQFVSKRALFGMGIGYIDAHLLTAVRLRPGTLLWTRDKRLREVATKLGLSAAER
jgi:predicted nucleic acid-binding protein